ncbi:MAG: transporter substrate-binding domain-containing protein [Firmicutes bacterium]|nr:transporter substrate-binding domain-containing protein [Bacillota bacterium]
MKRFIIIFLILILTVTITACSNEKPASTLDKDTLVVGMELAYPPFELTDKEGNPSGISVDLAKALGEYLGKNIRIENMAYQGLIPSLKTGKIDLIISSMTITDERLESIDFSNPYCRAYLSVLANKNSDIESIDDLNKKGKKVAVKKGTTGHIYASENLKNAEIMVFDKQGICVLEVTQGKADAFIYDQMTIYKNWKMNENKTTAILKPFQEEFEHWGIGMRKENDKLRKSVNEFLKEYKNQGGFDKLANKYLKEQKETFEKLNIPFFF